MIRLTDRPDMTLDVYRGRKTTTTQQQQRGAVVEWLEWLGYGVESRRKA